MRPSSTWPAPTSPGSISTASRPPSGTATARSPPPVPSSCGAAASGCARSAPSPACAGTAPRPPPGPALAGGIIPQKVTLRFGGKYRSWFLIGPLLFLPLSVLQFTKIGTDFTASAVIIFGFVTSHLLWNVVSAANGSMVGRLRTLPDERMILSSSRAQGMAAAGLLFSFTGMPLIVYFGRKTDTFSGFTLATAVFGVATILGYLYIYRLTAGRDPYDEAAAGALVASWIGVRIGKRKCYWMFLLLAGLLYSLARLTGGTSWGFTLMCSLAMLVYSIAVSMLTAIFSDTVIYGEWKTGKNIRAFTMALMNVPIKVGVFLRSVILSVGLAAIGFVANAAPTPLVISGISSMITLIPAAACIIAAAIFYFGYRLDDRQVLRMQEEIASR